MGKVPTHRSADIGAWKAGEWHHVAATFSASGNYIRFYLDGVKVRGPENNEGHYYPPLPSGRLGSDRRCDLCRRRGAHRERSTVSGRDQGHNAARSAPFGNNEVMVPLMGVAPDLLTYSVNACGSASYIFHRRSHQQPEPEQRPGACRKRQHISGPSTRFNRPPADTRSAGCRTMHPCNRSTSARRRQRTSASWRGFRPIHVS